MEPISLACKIVGSQARLALLVGVTPSAVNQWISGNRPVPIERCVAIEKATKGMVTRKDLRPADWQMIWPELMGDEEKCLVDPAAA